MIKPAVGYCRVSTVGQAVEGISLDAQQERIRSWTTSEQHPLAGMLVDAGKSGKSDKNRPGLHDALDLVCEKRGVLVVYSLSRMSRSTADTIAIATRLEKAGADLASISERIDTTSAMGRFFFTVIAAIATLEREMIVERVTEALGYLRSQGKRISGHAPYGFKFENGIVVPEPAEQESAILIETLRESGLGYKAILSELNKREIKARDGGPFSLSTVRHVLAKRGNHGTAD
jgi:DNA invertase Pin-like site-specific DNA recombinase